MKHSSLLQPHLRSASVVLFYICVTELSYEINLVLLLLVQEPATEVFTPFLTKGLTT